MNTDQLLNNYFAGWMEAGAGPMTDIVISSRIRLARNLSGQPFPHLIDQEQGKKCLNLIKDAWDKSAVPEESNMVLYTMDQLSQLERQVLMEKHLISPLQANSNHNYRGLLVNEDGSAAIMINEEDHLRIQCILPGLQLAEAYRKAQGIDDRLEKHLNLAFDENRGYLTSCPTNVGTGMRASVMLHLPAISISGMASRIFQNISQLGMTVRGLYGEGTEVLGNLIQLSNQVTLGQSEEDIISNLSSITVHVVEQEKIMRSKLQSEMKYQIEDRVGRALGLLTHARIMTSNEAMALISDLRLGVDLGIIQGIEPVSLNSLMVAISPAHLQKRAGQEMEGFQRDIYRSQVIQEIINKN
ncbi:protein arginine kinase [Syntrophomonas palmitatica]|uniref:protein arginine kinase n=1 Tax=Syntrophomonas palmitatica TaxID=402877 RepID=UPI0006D21D00|nr:protein arginine kinase [Syntrophomonas palmitatica]